MASFDQFDLSDHVYKTVNNHSIELTVLVPKNITSGTHPIVLRWHGGGLITGARMFKDWCPGWLLEHAIANQAILVFPDHRLLPEATGADIVEDISDAIEWIQTSLPSVLASREVVPDLHDILVAGESAGGYMAAQTSLLHPSSAKHTIRAAILTYPELDFEGTLGTPRKIAFFGGQEVPRKVIDDHVASVKAGEKPSVVSNAVPPARFELMLPIAQEALWMEYLGVSTDKAYPFRNAAQIKPGQSIPTWILHGLDDSVIPFEGSERYFAVIKKNDPQAKTLLRGVEGKEHGFDSDAEYNTETECIKQGLDFISTVWPHNK